MMTEQEYISAAIGKLVTGGFILSGTPTNATEFKEMYKKAQDDGTHAPDTSITWTQVKSKVTEVKAGDSFVFPKGWKGTAEVKETIRKVYMMLT